MPGNCFRSTNGKIQVHSAKQRGSLSEDREYALTTCRIQLSIGVFEDELDVVIWTAGISDDLCYEINDVPERGCRALVGLALDRVVGRARVTPRKSKW